MTGFDTTGSSAARAPAGSTAWGPAHGFLCRPTKAGAAVVALIRRRVLLVAVVQMKRK